MAKTGRLGRGLDALLENSNLLEDDSLKPNKDAGAELFVDQALLKPNPHQPRQDFDDESLQELADSIKEHGIIQPIIAEEAGDGSYYIIAGERRTRAARLAGLKQVPVIIKNFSDEKKLEIALIENIQREDLNPVEEAQAYHKLMVLGNLNQEELARRVGKNRSTVANALRLLKLPDDISVALADGTISSGHARAILSVLNPSEQNILFARIVESELSVRDAERIAQELNEGGRATSKKTGSSSQDKTNQKKSIDILDLEQKFINALGTKVSIKGSLEKGILEISYFSQDDLDRIFQLFIP